MAAPFVLGAFVLIAAPALVTAGYAFTSYDGFSSPRFVGLGTIRSVLSDYELHRSLRASAAFLVLAVPLRVGGSLLLALLADGQGRLASATRVAIYTPAVIPDPATALIWLWIVNPLYGPVGALVRLAGGTAGPVLLDPWGARLTIVALSTFALGEGFLVTVAARRELPEILYDAARLEGAGPLARFRRITLPLLSPTLALLLARDLLASMQAALVPTLLLTNGGPLHATLSLPALVYEKGFLESRLGEAAAVAVVTLVLAAILIGTPALLLWWRAARRANRSSRATHPLL